MTLKRFKMLVIFLTTKLFSVVYTMNVLEDHFNGNDERQLLDTFNVRTSSIKSLLHQTNDSEYDLAYKFESVHPDKSISFSNTFDKQDKERHITKRESLIKQFRIDGEKKITFTEQSHCSIFGNCSFNANKSHPVCYCDAYCSIFRDCCFNADIINESAVIDTEHYARLLQYVECYYNERFYGTVKKYNGYYVIQVCPSNFTDLKIIQQCQFSNFIHPVTSDNDGISYINEYCALCHDVTKYRHWNTVVFRFLCPKLDILSINETNVGKRLAFFKEHCDWKFVPADGSKPRVCRNILQSDTNSCPKFLSPVFQIANDTLHRNYLCLSDIQNDFYCIIPKDMSLSERGFGSHAITVMFKMHPPKTDGNRMTCQIGETYHKDSDMCFPDDCEGWNLDNHCNIETYTNHEIRVDFWLKSNKNLGSDRNIASRAISALHAFIPAYYDVTVIRNSGEQCCDIIYTLTVFKIQRKLSLANIALVISNLQNLNFTYHEINDDFNITLRRINISKESDFKYLANYSVAKQNKALLRFNNMMGEFDKIRRIMTINVSSEVKAIPTDLEINSYLQISPTTGKLLKMTIKDVSYEYKNNTYNISFEYKFRLPGNKTAKITSQGTLTYVCMCVSCTFLVIIIALYLHTNMYKSPPGTLSIHMMICLLFSQIFFMSGIGVNDKGYYVCLVLGIISHYLWLTTFVWIFLFMIHITKTVVRVDSNPNGSDLRVSCWNYVFGYGSAWLIVVPSIFLELCQCSTIHIGYTSEVCFPTGYPGNIFVFTGPVLLSLLINCLMLVMNIILISKYRASVRSHSLNVSRSYLFTYIKLCFISSCPWLIGFLGELFQSDVLKFIFVLLSGSHGFIVSVCFLSSKRILSLFRTKFSSKSKSKIADTRL